MSERDLSGRIALVTGGSRGIGRAICRRLARAGAWVAVNHSASDEAAAETVAGIEAEGRRSLRQADYPQLCRSTPPTDNLAATAPPKSSAQIGE